ncbi:unnamed protein product [Linum trigynum]|uniref:Uncharacterized protein n=1 Tax=Linum trigynum TaxID=586398 RepID=A0AAV2EQ85_9ROSI
MAAVEKAEKVAQEKSTQGKNLGSQVDNTLDDLTDTEALRTKVDKMEVTLGELDVTVTHLSTGQHTLNQEVRLIREMLEQLLHAKTGDGHAAQSEPLTAQP